MPCQACGCRAEVYKKFGSKYFCEKHYKIFVMLDRGVE